MCELLATALEIVAVLRLDGVLDSRRHGVVCRQDGALDELDLTGHATLQSASRSRSATGLLALSPGLGGAGLAPRVGRGRAVRSAKVASRVVATRCRVDVRPDVCVACILRRAVARVCLCQAVGRVWAVLRVAVEGVVVGACRILVQERAADFFLVAPAGSVLGWALANTSRCGLPLQRAVTHFIVMGVPIVLLVVRHDVQRSRGWHCVWRGPGDCVKGGDECKWKTKGTAHSWGDKGQECLAQLSILLSST